jgi:hypothetical protein
VAFAPDICFNYLPTYLLTYRSFVVYGVWRDRRPTPVASLDKTLISIRGGFFSACSGEFRLPLLGYLLASSPNRVSTTHSLVRGNSYTHSSWFAGFVFLGRRCSTLTSTTCQSHRQTRHQAPAHIYLILFIVHRPRLFFSVPILLLLHRPTMAASLDDKATKPYQLTVLTKEVDLKSSNLSAHDGNLAGSFDSHRGTAPSTPTSALTCNGFDTDIEAMKPVQSSDHLTKTSTCGTRFNSDSSVWPGQAHWREKALAAERKNRSCQCMTRLSKRTRIAVKIAIALFVVGVAVGVGFGISKPLGATIWQPKGDHR